MADERTKDLAINVNDKIQDRTIRHMVFLERFKAGQVKRLQKILDTEIIPEITNKLEKRLLKITERGTDMGPVSTQRLKDLEKELKILSRDMVDKLKRSEVFDIDALTKDELDWQAHVIRESMGFDLEMVIPNARAVAALIKRTSFAGLTLDQWFDTIDRSTQRNVMSAVQRGLVEGETTAEIMRRVRGTKQFNFKNGVMETTRRQAEAITRSTINHATNRARDELFKANADIIKGVQWIATLDSRTSVICAGLDGRVFPIDKGPRPPAHVNCRSSITAIMKSADQIGVSKIPEGKRASMNGQVPSTTTYGEWLKRQPAGIQEEVLGVTKAKLFRDGNLSIDKFTNKRLKPLSLDELRVLEKKSFETAGL